MGLSFSGVWLIAFLLALVRAAAWMIAMPAFSDLKVIPPTAIAGTAAGLAVLEVLEVEHLKANALATGEYLRERLSRSAARHACLGALRGTAHAGAQGDTAARVAALELAPTQLRIATCIAADDVKHKAREPEVAFIRDERIAIAPYAKAGLR